MYTETNLQGVGNQHPWSLEENFLSWLGEYEKPETAHDWIFLCDRKEQPCIPHMANLG